MIKPRSNERADFCEGSLTPYVPVGTKRKSEWVNNLNVLLSGFTFCNM